MRRSKEQIIEAVKVAAKQEGVDTIGRSRFEALSGIREAEWKWYWAKWNSLLEEAGLAPGQKTVRMSDENLLAAIFPLVRHLGSWPTAAEMRIWGRDHSGFPNYDTVRLRGDRVQLAGLMVTYCRENADMSDVADICREIVETNQDSETVSPAAAVQGHVYMMKSGKDYKIGKSISVRRRHGEIAPLLPNTTEIIHSIPTDDPDGIERYWHIRFESKRVRGEWFRLDASDVQAFKRRQKYM